MSKDILRVLVIGGDSTLSRYIKREFGVLTTLRKPTLNVVALSKSECDITNQESIRYTLVRYHPDVIINTARCAADSAADDLPLEMVIESGQVNTMGPGNVVVVCDEYSKKTGHRPKYIQLSSTLVYKHELNSYSNEDSEIELGIDDPLLLRDLYAAEHLIRKHYDNHVILRVPSLYGPWSGGFFDSIVSARGQSTLSLEVMGHSLMQPMSYMMMAGILKYIVYTCPHLVGTYNVASNNVASLEEFMLYCIEGLDIPSASIIKRTASGAVIGACLADTTKLIRATGIVLSSWEEDLRRNIELVTSIPLEDEE